jgi:hypothetical protein
MGEVLSEDPVRRGKVSSLKRTLIVFALFAVSIFQPWMVFAGAPVLQAPSPQSPSSQSPSALVSSCIGTSGSDTAEELLAQLKSQPQQVTTFIERCEARARTLRQQEEKDWIAALDAKTRWDCADARRLFKKLSDKATFYKKQSSAEVKRLGDCGERLPPGNDPDMEIRNAKDAYRSRDFGPARESAWRLVARQDSVGKEAKSLIQELEQVEVFNESLRQADNAIRDGRATEACGLLIRIQQAYPAVPNIGEARSRQQSVCPVQPKTATTPNERQGSLDKRLQEAKRFLADGNIELAGDSLAVARSLSPNNSTVEELGRELDAATRAREALETGITLRRGGKYLQAIERFKDAVTLQAASGIGARAHFEMGVTLATQYFLNSGENLKTAAQQEFRESALNYSNPDFELISPRIKELYEQAVKGKVG